VADATTGSDIGDPDGSAVADADAQAEADLDAPSEADADPLPVPPPMNCDVDASTDDADADGAEADVEACPLPPSVCAPRSSWPPFVLVYYSDGTCVSGVCTWVAHTIPCTLGCDNGACIESITAPPPR
jgi:hypothetical protein